MITAQPPVIIIGMHCSGTSLVTRMLEKLGLFIGWKKDCNNEALFFQNLNRWLLRQCGGSWDHPEPIKNLLSDQEIRPLVVEYMSEILNSPRAVSYLGVHQHLKYRHILDLDIPWGWKDPRNTFTLPLWLDIFPGAKLIHIYRHGVDVAQSLKNRREKLLTEAKLRYLKFKHFCWLRPKRAGFTDSLRVGSLKNGLALWEEYINEAHRHVSSMDKQSIEVQFEDLLSDPINQIKILVNFIGLPPVKDKIIDSLIKDLRKDQLFAYQNHPDLTNFAVTMSNHLKKNGYSP